ncbi:hypothetical protein EDD99_5364 [Streptomyces sp. 846.5]|nr:hypothetical protein [Streptomyces sp. 846.5]TDT97254.1 hypothetical protein EDD99_5364 [Streptomyces sp. 846.5]
MLLKPGVTCEQAIKFLEDLTWGSLGTVRNAIPQFAIPMVNGLE